MQKTEKVKDSIDLCVSVRALPHICHFLSSTCPTVQNPSTPLALSELWWGTFRAALNIQWLNAVHVILNSLISFNYAFLSLCTGGMAKVLCVCVCVCVCVSLCRLVFYFLSAHWQCSGTDCQLCIPALLMQHLQYVFLSVAEQTLALQITAWCKQKEVHGLNNNMLGITDKNCVRCILASAYKLCCKNEGLLMVLSKS